MVLCWLLVAAAAHLNDVYFFLNEIFINDSFTTLSQPFSFIKSFKMLQGRVCLREKRKLKSI